MPAEATALTLEPHPAAVAAPSVPMLRRLVAEGDLEPHLRAARAELAGLVLRQRAAERAAERLERSDVGAVEPDADAVAAATDRAWAVRRAELDAECEQRRVALAADLAEERARAQRVVDDARREAVAVLAAARDRLNGVFAGVEPPAVEAPALAAPALVEPPAAPLPIAPPATPPAAPLAASPDAPQVAPMVFAYMVPSADGGPPMLVAAPLPTAVPFPGGQAMAPGAVMPGWPAPFGPTAADSPVADADAPAIRVPWRARFLHLDVILPLVAMVIVVVVLLAWMG